MLFENCGDRKTGFRSAVRRHGLVTAGAALHDARVLIPGLCRFAVIPACLALLVVATGCQRQPDGAKERAAPNPNAPAAYPVVTTVSSSHIARVRPPFS